MTPEGKVKKYMTDGLEQMRAYWFFPATHGYGRSGVADIIACINGKFFALECKAEEGMLPTKLQEAELAKVNEQGGYGIVVDGLRVAEKTLQYIEEVTGRMRERGTERTATKSRRGKKVSRLRADD